MENENLAFTSNVKWKQFILTAGILLVLIFFYHWRNPPTQQDVIQQVFGGQQNFDTFLSSTQVSAQRLHNFYDPENPTNFYGYFQNAAVSLSPVQIQKIKNLLQSPASYRFDVGDSCVPEYGVLLKFPFNQKTIYVALCFKCELLAVFSGENNQASLVTEDKIFTPMRPQLVSITKTIFPDDKEIQSLKEKSH